jgi:hypothetical protein
MSTEQLALVDVDETHEEPVNERTPAATGGLTDLERQVLEFERTWWKHAGAKDTEIRRRWDISPTRYYQILGALLDRPAALEHDPMLVRRLLRLRDERARQRSARR